MRLRKLPLVGPLRNVFSSPRVTDPAIAQGNLTVEYPWLGEIPQSSGDKHLQPIL